MRSATFGRASPNAKLVPRERIIEARRAHDACGADFERLALARPIGNKEVDLGMLLACTLSQPLGIDVQCHHLTTPICIMAKQSVLCGSFLSKQVIRLDPSRSEES